tara:strand:- start:20543 stop:23749 length:3207 start_codon:yes stop_codon:yes gene_type:complete
MNMFAEKIRMRPSARNTLRPLLLAATILPTALCAQSLDTILGQTELLESNRDPKCEATAARLEDFIYGTPLTQEARFRKHDLQVNLVSLLWSKASAAAQADKRSFIDKGDINKTASQLFLAQGKLDGSWRIVAGGDEILISARDFRQYTSVAYALRAVLAVQQEQLFGSSAEEALLELSPSAVDALKLQVDLFTLATLNRADRVARAKSEHELTETRLVSAWNALAKVPQRAQLDKAAPSGSQQTKGGYPVLTPLIERKIASYEAYNQISGPIFLRNIQVYFARHGWPSDEEKGTQFKAQFTELMIQFSRDLLLGSQQIAAQAQHPLIRPADVGEYARRFVPHEVNAYEDVIFFPRLQDDQRVTLEAYDLDAFRDPGLHWRYLQAAMESVDEPSPLEPDPFAAELLVENIAQFGVLVLRLAGEASREQGHKVLSTEDLKLAVSTIQTRVKANAEIKSETPRKSSQALQSAQGAQSAGAFADVSKASGIDYQHRSADWLARRLRTYTPGEDGVGNATIPPAFGGSGLAAEDIDNDGHVDLLFLGGAGARLYRNQGDGSFKDVSREMGLQWNRKSDGLPGEMRQPIIADLDNDGWQDVVITYVDEAHRVYRNLQGKGFEDVTEKAALGGAGAVGGPATVADFNNDGLLDIYIGYFGDYVRGALPTLARRNTNGGQNRLYFGKGDFKFVDVSKGSGTEGHGWTQAVGHTDFDGDGLQDLIEGNDFGVNAYYRNLGDGKFAEVSAQLGTDKPSYTMNVGIADLNDDDLPDIYISNIVTMNKDQKYVLPGAETSMNFNPDKLANMRVVEANDLFLSVAASDRAANVAANTSDGANAKQGSLPRYALSDRVGRGYHSTGWSWDADFFDFDHDGDMDLYVTNGMNEFNVYSTQNAYYQDPDGNAQDVRFADPNRDTNVLFANQDGHLENITSGSGLDLVSNSRSAVFFDHDQDGDLDVAVNNYHGQAVMLENQLKAKVQHWLQLRLIGKPEQGINRDAIGARIRVLTPDGKRHWREVHGTTGYLSVHPKAQHFGLGAADMVDIEVRWPNGSVQTLHEVAADQRYSLAFDGELERY